MTSNLVKPNRFTEWLGRTVLKCMGWRIEGELPKLDKFVAIGAHHTSNWDFVVFLATKFILRLNVRWFGKHSIFRWPFGALLRRFGGIAIERHLSQNVVEQAIQSFRDHSHFILVLSPEGTRKKVERWKMGFYHIALGAKVPIVPGALDYAKRRVVIGRPFTPSGNMQADLQELFAFFKPYIPKYPQYAFHGD